MHERVLFRNGLHHAVNAELNGLGGVRRTGARSVLRILIEGDYFQPDLQQISRRIRAQIGREIRGDPASCNMKTARLTCIYDVYTF